MTLPDEAYYREPRHERLLASYLVHVGKMLGLAKIAKPEDAAEKVLAMETAIAKGHWDIVSHPRCRQDLQQALTHAADGP